MQGCGAGDLLQRARAGGGDPAGDEHRARGRGGEPVKTSFVYSQCTRVLFHLLTCPGGGGHEVLTGFRAGQTLDLCWIVDGRADHLLCRGARGRLYAFHVDQVSCLPRVDSHRLAQITVKGMHFFV